ncbi:unnamed protein product, partial [Closterium sp. NIES-54]
GYKQKEKVEYMELFAPVTTLQTLLAGATIKGWVVKQMDVTTTFLNGVLEEIFMAQPEGFDDGSGRVWKMKKALYGLKQAPRQWSFMVVYMDNILIFSPSSDLVKEVMLKLQDKFKCKALGDVSFYLGLDIERDVEKRCMRVHQRKYLEALAANFGQIEGHLATPFPYGFNYVKGSEEESVGEEERRNFHSLVGSLMDAGINTRPDVAFATGQVARVVECPNEEHVAFGMRRLFLTAFSDASYASKQEDMTSMGVFILCVGGGPNAWESKKQVDHALSTVESEYMALFRADVMRVVFGNDKSLPVVGVGSTRLIVDGGPVDITNVLHVPGLKVNLLSVTHLVKMGVKVTIDDAKMNLFWKGERFSQGVLNGELYQLKTHLRVASSNVVQGSKATLKRAWRVWDLGDKRVVMSRDVVFDEDKFPTKEQLTPQLTVVLPVQEEDEAIAIPPQVEMEAENGGGENKESDDDVVEVSPTTAATSSTPSSLPLALTRRHRTIRPNTKYTDYATVAIWASRRRETKNLLKQGNEVRSRPSSDFRTCTNSTSTPRANASSTSSKSTSGTSGSSNSSSSSSSASSSNSCITSSSSSSSTSSTSNSGTSCSSNSSSSSSNASSSNSCSTSSSSSSSASSSRPLGSSSATLKAGAPSKPLA